MEKPQPPKWRDDPFSTFFREAEYNAQATAANYPDVFAYLARIHSAFRRAEEALEKDSSWLRLVPRFLLIRTHSSVLAAVRSAMSGQVAESYPQLRAAIEQAWYALHIASDPNPDNRVDIWLRRNEGESATARCRSEFSIKNVHRGHETLDSETAAEMRRLYETLIDHGAHPNQLGVFSGLRAKDSPTEMNFQVGVLYIAELPLMVSLRLSAAVAIGALKTFRLVYPERFAFVSLDGELDSLAQELNSRFKRFGRSPTA